MPNVTVHHGDSRDVLKTLDANSIDSVATDPPYALVSIVKRFGAEGAAPAQGGVYARASAGFMGQAWDTGETAFDPAFWVEVFRVMKPGAHLAAFGGTRTYHRLVCAIEDAGFEVRDQLAWLYGSGFPKSHDVSRGIDKRLGLERTKVRIPASQVRNPKATGGGKDGAAGAARPFIDAANERGYHEAASDEAAQWKGWGSALKPAHEPIVLARKPLEGTLAANVMKWGAGGLNIDGCRVGWASEADAAAAAAAAANGFADSRARGTAVQSVSIGRESRDGTNTYDPSAIAGRWPANVVHDGSDEVLAAFPEAPGQQAPLSTKPGSKTQGIYGRFDRAGEDSAHQRYAERGSTNFAPLPGQRRADEGSAARFFYSAKADSLARLGGKHPTVKPTDLMRWLVTLITPPGGVVLDPFAGSGSTAIGAIAAGFDSVMIEREAEYVEHIRERVAWAQGQGALTSGLTTRNKPKAALDGLLGLMGED